MDSPHSRSDRATMPVRFFRLGEEPSDDLSATTTPAQRVEMVIALSARMLELGVRPPQSYARSEMPIRVLRPE